MARNVYSLCLFVLGLILITSTSCNNDIPLSTKFTQNMGIPTIKFFYCYSCGYRKAYDQYVGIVQQRYPYMNIEGANYEPSAFYNLLARAISILRIFFIVCILSGINIFEYINQPMPGWWRWAIENRLYACMMLFFTSNLIGGQLVQTGAFEIFLNDVPLWSKLETGRIPQPPELFQIIDSHMQFDSKVDLKHHHNFVE